MGFWENLLIRLPDVLIVLVSASIGFFGGLATIGYQIKKQNESKIRSYVHVTISEIYNNFIYAFEMYLCCYCRYKTSRGVFVDRHISPETLRNVTTGMSDCLTEDFLSSYIRMCHLRDTQEMLLKTGRQCLVASGIGKHEPKYWRNRAMQFARLSNYIAYTGAKFVNEMPKRLRSMVNGVEGLKKGLNLQIDDSKKTILRMNTEATSKEMEKDLTLLIDEAEKLMEVLEKEMVEGKYFHIMDPNHEWISVP